MLFRQQLLRLQLSHITHENCESDQRTSLAEPWLGGGYYDGILRRRSGLDYYTLSDALRLCYYWYRVGGTGAVVIGQ